MRSHHLFVSCSRLIDDMRNERSTVLTLVFRTYIEKPWLLIQ